DGSCLRADVGGDGVVPAVQGGTQRRQASDGHDGDERGDQTVLDRSGARAVLQNLANETDHDTLSLRVRGTRRTMTAGSLRDSKLRACGRHLTLNARQIPCIARGTVRSAFGLLGS